MKTEKLDFCDCARLLEECVDNELVMRDPNNKDNIVVYVNGDENNPEGWYSVDLFVAAWELHYNLKGQQAVIDALFQKTGIRFKPEPLSESIRLKPETWIERD